MSRESRLLYFVVCDLARTEDSGKGLFVGVYGAAIIVNGSFPALLPSLALVACCRAVKPTEKVGIRLAFPGSDAISTEMQTTAKHPGDTHTIVTQFIPCMLQAPGLISVEYSFEDGTKEGRSIQVMNAEERDKLTWKNAH